MNEPRAGVLDADRSRGSVVAGRLGMARGDEVLTYVQGEGYWIWRGRELKTNRLQVLAIFEHLLERKGHWRSKADLYPVLWPAAMPDTADKCISVAASRLASILIGTSARIEARQYFGYRLVGDIEVV